MAATEVRSLRLCPARQCIIALTLLFGLLWGSGTALSLERPEQPGTGLRFFVVGDAPYGNAEYAPFKRLLQEAAEQDPPFIVHVGDIKGGGEPCTEARNRRIAELFQAQPVPVLYTPGDNEWTDCHRQSAGGLDPIERLAALRARFFADPEVLHNAALKLQVPDPAYPENAYTLKDGVMLVLLHLVGSNNNHRSKNSAAMAEWRQRSAANRRLLREATRLAQQSQARAMVLFFHANPLFERSPPSPGFAPLMSDLEALLSSYSGPVLAVHGDTHRFQFNQPLLRNRSAVKGAERLWRLEVPGSPFLGGVWVSLTSDPAEPFAISVVYPSAAEAFKTSLSGGH
ncbi:MAG: metallophosphoesterase family protein [Lamprobacter sp.]|uniref:metallophosphoesterase family protein n=1 Tax=Lamprobacter sp. TaxID=3100796 RepID=UPI002B260455|nr:metallophosphoesterase family protein [Lamprobacter sp.]MEA3641274.1 metallophosphoesterase family protein [Lamprobacter sp.]